MPEPVLYMRGMQHLRDHSISEEMVDDLSAIKQIEPDLLERIATELSSIDGFLEPSALNARLKSLLAGREEIDSLRRVILNIKSEDVGDLLKRLQSFQEDDPKNFRLSVEDLNELSDRLPRLLKPIPALRRYRKAERLAKLTGQPLEDIQLVCDLRPVFDQDRNNIEGLIPLTHLKVVATGEDGLPDVFEADLTAKQVQDLAEQAEKAVRKLVVLREKADEWGDDGMPNIPLVRPKAKGSTDD